MLEGFTLSYLAAVGILWFGLWGSAYVFVRMRPWRAQTRWARLGVRFLLSFGTLALVCLTLETGFALFYDATDSFSLVKTSQRWTARHVRLNNMDYRDRKDFTAAKPDDRYRILLLGDSFAYGHGIADVDKRFGDLLEQRCQQTFGAVEIYNVSEPGLSTAGEVKRLEEFAQRGPQSDAVLLIYNLNDLDDVAEESRYMVGTIILDKPSNVLFRESYLLNFLYYRYKQFSRPEFRDYFRWLTESYRGETWKRQTANFDSLRKQCDALGVKLLVVVFPFLHNLGAEYPFRHAHANLAEYWRPRADGYLDLLEVMEWNSSKDLVVNQFDAHPNETAHRLAAEAIWSDLLKSFLNDELSQDSRPGK